MVKTRQQEKQEQIYNKYDSAIGVLTRAGAKKNKNKNKNKKAHTHETVNKLERVELPKIILSKEMKKRFQIKKAISKKSRELQIEKNLKKMFKYHRQYKEHRKQNNDELLAIWKNFDSVFHTINELCTFKDRVEGK
jgi:hypothetical protein